MQRRFIFDAAPFASAHASTIVETTDGLLAAWFGGTREGHRDVTIWSSRLKDQQWSPPVQVADDKRHPCWNPVLFQPRDGPLLLFYHVGPNPRRWWGMLMRSKDAGQTWSKPERLPGHFLGPIRNKPIEQQDDSLLCPSSTEHLGWCSHIERFQPTEDHWQHVAHLNPPWRWGAIQPTLLDWGGGRIQALCRSRQRLITECWSEDNGQSWSPMQATQLPNPDSGIDAAMLPDGRAVLIYNDSRKRRRPINIATSTNGKSWHPGPVLEQDPGNYSYPAVIVTKAGHVHITYTWNRLNIAHVDLPVGDLSS